MRKLSSLILIVLFLIEVSTCCRVVFTIIERMCKQVLLNNVEFGGILEAEGTNEELYEMAD